MRGLLGCFLTALLLGGTPSAIGDGDEDKLNLFPDREVVQCVKEKNADLDGDGKQDFVCITIRKDEGNQCATVVLSSAPPHSPPAIDAPILHCPGCFSGGVLPGRLEITGDSSPPGGFTVSETGGRSSTMTYEYEFKRAGMHFGLTNERQEGNDPNGSSGSLATSYEFGVGRSSRTASPADAAGGSAEFLNVYAMPFKGAIKIDGDGSEPAWQQALRLPASTSKYVLLERSKIKSDKDLSYGLRALWDKDFLYLLVEVTDDHVVLTPPGKSGVRYDHLELWFAHGDEAWGENFAPRMQPDSTKTFQLGLVPQSGSDQVRVVRWFPDEMDLPQVTAAYRRSATGYVIEARFPRELVGLPARYLDVLDALDRREGLVLMTVVVSDADRIATPQQEKMLATSRLEHRGAPFEMGLLHLMKSVPPNEVEKMQMAH